MVSGQIGILAAIVIYLAAMVYVGFYFSKQGSGDSADDFYLGGRKLGPLVTAMSAEASDMSSWLLMGLPGVAYLSGIADAGWTAIGLGIGTYLNWLIVSTETSPLFCSLQCHHHPGFLLQTFSRSEEYPDVHLRDHHPDFLYSVHRLRL